MVEERPHHVRGETRCGELQPRRSRYELLRECRRRLRNRTDREHRRSSCRRARVQLQQHIPYNLILARPVSRRCLKFRDGCLDLIYRQRLLLQSPAWWDGGTACGRLSCVPDPAIRFNHLYYVPKFHRASSILPYRSRSRASHRIPAIQAFVARAASHRDRAADVAGGGVLLHFYALLA
jgi:hypothetical protein